MTYLIFQMLLCLCIAFILGFLLGWLIISRIVREQFQGQINLLNTQLKNCKDKCESLEHDTSKTELDASNNENEELKAKVAEKDEQIKTLESQLKISQQAKKVSAGNSLLERADFDEHRPKFYEDMPKHFFTTPPNTIDDLKQISGVGEVLEKTLNELGIYQFRQVALFTSDDIDWVSKHLEQFKGRIEHDDWVNQAKELHKEKYGKDPE